MNNFKNPEIEQQVLKSFIKKPILAKQKQVSEEWFVNNSYRMIMSYINFYQGEPVNADQLQLKLKQEPLAHKIDIDSLFAKIMLAPNTVDVDSAIANLKLSYQQRVISDFAKNVSEQPTQANIDKLINFSDEIKVADVSSKQMFLNASDNMLKRLTTPRTNFVKTFSSLDDILNGGLSSNQLFIIGARPSVGKTAMAINLAYNAVLFNEGVTVELFSLEMSNEQNLSRLYSIATNMSSSKWVNPAVSMNDSEKKIASKIIGKVKQLPLMMNDKLLQIDDICATIKQHASELPVGKYLPIIDHFHLIENNSERDYRHALEVNSRKLKLLTQSLNIPIVLLAQLNREVEGRSTTVPKLSDLRETGTLEQDANIVGLLWDDDEQPEIINMSVKKNRDGRLGNIEFVFDKNTQKIVEMKN